jgi:spermidine/putrescine transport system ATP-binding protein
VTGEPITAKREPEPEPALAATNGRAPDVRLENVTKRFDRVAAVDDLSLSVEQGRFFALLGPSGCGKTTTLRMIGGFEQPTAGTIYLGDRAVSGLPPYKRDVNTVFQSYALFPHLSIFENIAFGLRRKRASRPEIAKRVEEMLELVGLAGLGRRKPKQLSGGQQQRVALARALVCKPRVLLLDEPLGALDLKLRKQMQLFLKGLQHDVGITFIHVTHDQEEAMTMADSIAVMNHGRIEQLGAPDQLYELPQTAFVAGFLGVSNLLVGTVSGSSRVRLDSGAEVEVGPDALAGRSGRVAVGIRPEKLRIGSDDTNVFEGRVAERAYIGVSTQYVVETQSGRVQVYVQNAEPGTRSISPGDGVTLCFSPDVAFVVDPSEEVEE